ncbi:hypothetical protein Leef1_8 [Polaribacter phage Leef_1]|uniref:Pectate lyase superfamily protein domain-containing protein n=1 Tax=Polaribacter phage Leef_1 TaxID=2745684 RepID=A0A8E5EA28_9CAUD|nr:tail spike protein [Polaribacter phage Leef_1]QQV91418.1 hypothetical protein Leef1_8 [Polaribacter phage Leef_1]
MSTSKKASNYLHDKTNSVETVDRYKESTAEDWKEVAEISDNHAEGIDANTIRSISNEDAISSLQSGYNGIVLIADTKTEAGDYRPGEEGTYPNCGGLVYDPTDTDKGFDVKFNLTNGVWTKYSVDLVIDKADEGDTLPESTKYFDGAKTADYIRILNQNKTDKGGYEGTSQDLKNSFDNAVFDGAITYQTEAELLAVSPTPINGTPAKVANDSDPLKNGNWSVVSGAWVKDASVVSNIVDNDDISTEGSGLIISNRNSGTKKKGYKIIREGFDFLNIPLTYADSIWEIRYANDLNGETISIPEGVTLSFKGGSFENGTIVGDDTKIVSDIEFIIDVTCELEGTFITGDLYPEMFGAVGNGVVDDTLAVQKALDLANISSYKHVKLLKADYLISDSIILKDFVNLSGYGVDQSNFIWGGVDKEDERRTMLMATSRVSYANISNFGLIGQSGAGKEIADIGFDCAFIRDCNLSQIQVKSVSYISFDIRSSRNGGFFDTPCIHNTFNVLGTFNSKSNTRVPVTTHAVLGDPVIVDGVITDIPIISGGLYTGDAPYAFVVGTGSGFTGTLALDGSGAVSSVNIEDGGIDYLGAFAFASTFNYDQSTMVEYGFRIREDANANTFINCKTNGSRIGFSEEGNEELGDNSTNVANQNTFMGCNAEPSGVGFFLKSVFNNHYGSRAEQCGVPVLIAQDWDYGANPSGNNFSGLTVYGKPTFLDPPYIYGATPQYLMDSSSTFISMGGVSVLAKSDDLSIENYFRLPVGDSDNRPDTTGFSNADRQGLMYYDTESFPVFNKGNEWVNSMGDKIDEIYKYGIVFSTTSDITYTTSRYTNYFLDYRDDATPYVHSINIDRSSVYQGKRIHLKINKEASSNITSLTKDTGLTTVTSTTVASSTTVTMSVANGFVVGDYLAIAGANAGETLYTKIVKSLGSRTVEVETAPDISGSGLATDMLLYYTNSANFEQTTLELFYTGSRWIVWSKNN